MTEQVSVNKKKKKLSCDSNSETQFPLDRGYSGPAVNLFVSRAGLFHQVVIKFKKIKIKFNKAVKRILEAQSSTIKCLMDQLTIVAVFRALPVMSLNMLTLLGS